MFSGLTGRLREDIQAIKDVATFTDHVREWIAKVPEIDEAITDLRKTAPKRPVWQIYDHCAALTRLYALYATYIEELATEYLRLIPTLYDQYQHLPEPILRQHRIGIAQILLKLGDTGPYRDLREHDVVEHLAKGLGGVQPYVLLPNAFFIDRQNYRLDALVRLFAFLGVDELGARLSRNLVLQRFLREQRGESTTLDAELSAFIQRRNEAAHSHVDEIIGLDEFYSLTDFILILSDALSELLEHEVIGRRVILGQAVDCGVVVETHYHGFVVIARMRATSLTRGDEILILNNARFIAAASIESLRLNNIDCEQLNTVEDQEVGIRLSARCIPGNTLARLTGIAQLTPPQLPLFVHDEYPEPETTATVTGDLDEQISELEEDADIAGGAPPASNP